MGKRAYLTEAQFREYMRTKLHESMQPRLTEGKYEHIGAYEHVGEFVPTFIVTVSGFQDPKVYNHFRKFVQDRNPMKDIPDQSGSYGTSYFNACLKRAINQSYGTSVYSDSTMERETNDPLRYTYSPRANECPFYKDADGFVRKKAGYKRKTGNFSDYSDYQEITWDMATERNGMFIFFFSSMEDREEFVKALKNMFWIARHLFKRDTFQYTFVANENDAFEIHTYTNEDPLKFLDPNKDKDLIDYVNKEIQNSQLEKNRQQPQNANSTLHGAYMAPDDTSYYWVDNGNGYSQYQHGFYGPTHLRESKNSRQVMKINEAKLRNIIKNSIRNMLMF